MKENTIKINNAVKKYMDGDKKAFTEIYELTHQATYYYIIGIVKNPDVADDIISDTYLQVVKSIGSLSAPEAFVSWLRTIAHSKCYKYFKKNGREVLVTEEEEPIFDTIENENEEFIPAAAIEKESDRNEIIRIINGLSDVQKQTIFMHYFDKMPVAKIAEIMECSENTVKSRLNYARKALKEMFVAEEKKGNKFYSVAPFMFMLFSREVQVVKVGSEVSRHIIECAETGITIATSTGVAGTIKGFFSTAAGKVTAASTAAKIGLGVGAAAVVATACIVPNIIETDEKEVVSELIPKDTISESYTGTTNDTMTETTKNTTEDLSLYKYKENFDGEIIITKYIGEETDITIPSYTEENKPITIIYDEAFMGTNIKSVVIPDTVTKICTAAFMDCQNLESVKMADSVEEIEGEAFKNCISLKKITLSESLSSIRWEVFRGCTSLKRITIPDNVTHIMGYAFGDCTRLNGVSIGKNIEYIAYAAFDGAPAKDFVENKYGDVITDTMVWGDIG